MKALFYVVDRMRAESFDELSALFAFEAHTSLLMTFQ
jgi:hypothetical protein